MDVYKNLYEQQKIRSEEYAQEIGRLNTELQLAIWERDYFQLRFEEVFRFLNDHSPNALAAFYHKHPDRMQATINALDRAIDNQKMEKVA